MKVLLLVVVGMMVMLQLPHQGNAECCIGLSLKLFGRKICNDCEYGTPYCGVGSCNIFGCNCDGGCRKEPCTHGHRAPYDVIPEVHVTARDVVAEADTNGDGRMSLKEARALLADVEFPADRVNRDLREMDLDKDSFLSPEEIDRDSY